MGDTIKTSRAELVSVGDNEEVLTDLSTGQYKLKCSVLMGFVHCDTDPNLAPVPGIIVKAVNLSTNEHYLGMTHENGFYSICVPAGKYMLFTIKCDDSCLKPIPCKKKKHYK